MGASFSKVSSMTLDQAQIGETWVVGEVLSPNGGAEWARLLDEIGFIEGEQVRIMAKGVPGADPLVVRVGQSTFALRRAEAACIRLVPLASFVSHAKMDVALEGAGA